MGKHEELSIRAGAWSCICFVSFLMQLFELYFVSPLRVERAGDWSALALWSDASCRVLSVGRAYRGTEWPGTETDSLGNLLGDCPGLYWCADEGGLCECPGGDVTFSPGEYEGNSQRGPQSVLHQASTVRCGPPQTGDEQGFPDDPAVGITKHCYCTPRQVVATLAGRDPQAQSCAQQADSIYDGLDSYWYAGVSTAAQPPAGVKAPEGNVTAEGKEEGVEPDNLIEQSSGSRRRGSVRAYMPWALVEVREVNAFGEASSPKVRCAYEFGAPHASRDDAYNSYMDEEESRWHNSEGDGLPCQVRSGSDACVVALEPLDELAMREIDANPTALTVALVCLVFSLSCGGFAIHINRDSTLSTGTPLVASVPVPLRQQPLHRQVSSVLLGRSVSAHIHGSNDIHSGDRVNLVNSKGGITAPSEGLIVGIDGTTMTYMDDASGAYVEVGAADVVKL